jgi:DNA mismatch endonuclease (patch repair protein)
MDALSPERRSALMRRVKQTNTKPEVSIRRLLHHRGFRYLIGDRRLPGTPDLVFPRHKTVVFVHGCFWHGHTCRQGRLPSTNVEYWKPKIARNRARDARKERALKDLGWRVLVVWECQFRTRDLDNAVDELASKITASLRPNRRDN